MDFISDIQRNFMPLPETFREQMQPTDGFVCAYPRSGSRWLMRVLSDVASVAYGLEVPNYEQTHVHRPPAGSAALEELKKQKTIFTDAHFRAREMSALIPLGRSLLFRSHHLAEVILRCSGPIVYLAREAVPSLYSYYHFARQSQSLAEDTTLEAFCESHVALWKDHVSTMLALGETAPDRVCFITYRDPGPFTKSQVESCAAHFSIPVKADTTDWALGRLGELLAKLNAQPTRPHQRGANQALKEGFPPELRHWIEVETQELFEQVKLAEEARSRA